MALQGTATPFSPRGLYDSLDGETAGPGACFYLTNLIHDVTTIGAWQPRPAAIQLTNFPGITSPGVVSVGFVVGTRIYGMIASARFAGNDEPFIYDTQSNTFITVANVTAANTPASQPTTGDWTPPTMDAGITRIVVTHPGFSGGNFFGWFDISSFTLNFVGNIHTTTTVDGLSVNPLNVGIMPGQGITGAGISSGTYVVSYTATSITLSQAATTTATGTSFTVAGGSLAAPLWGAGNTNTNALPAVPNAVMHFYNRAWFAVKNQAWFSDALNSGNISNATNFITCGAANEAIVGFGGLPVTQTIGGILAALIVFKSAGGFYQVTGDISANSLAVNGPTGAVACVAQRSIVQTPRGLWFMAHSGIHQIDFNGLISPAPIKGVRYPFHYSTMPSRAAASFNNTVYRISATTVPNLFESVQRQVEYWYDFEIDEWSGPHSCGNDLCLPIGNSFVFASNAQPGALYQSDVDVEPASTFVEFGTALSVYLESCVLPANRVMAANSIIEATVDLATTGGAQNPSLLFLDSLRSTIATASIPIRQSAPLWDNFNWGAANWGASPVGLITYNVDWPYPIVFKRGAYAVSGVSFLGFKIGAFWYRLQPLGYLNVQQPP